ncbi:LysR substrate-binding domain-containing protein [Cellvibrio sp. PSBB006]|uniref:LysR substrate-binding domain-containing protein n=1 Tax=Cellvibrio sp. PSBB006 TaxID=1987723 RepID=UPI000B3B5C8D|nr:LysR substrate-binding domain-containing protein [Cellvibrio sp. PSBB006]ARU27908.1 LysR family transcriptional regulator [Cellvibrio sp. PSBB006]
MRNLNDFYLFVQAVDCQGFAPASRQLGIPKATLSKRVAALEDALGVRLIQRTSRRFVVTDTGKDFYRHAAAMLIEAEAAENIVRGRMAEPNGLVRITASIPTAQLFLAPLLPELAGKYPKLRIDLDATDRFVDVIQEGFDIVVRDHFSPLPNSELVQRQLCVDPVFLVASPAYLDTFGAPKTPQDLIAHHGLLTATSASSWSLTHMTGSKTKVTPISRFMANDTTTLINAASYGLGITCLPRQLCMTELLSGRLVQVLEGWTAGEVTTTLLMPHRRGLLPSVRAVVEFLFQQKDVLLSHGRM